MFTRMIINKFDKFKKILIQFLLRVKKMNLNLYRKKYNDEVFYNK